MRVLIFLAAAILTGALASAPALAAGTESAWRLTSQEGDVRVQPPGQPLAAAKTGDIIVNGATVTTGAESRATLENGQQHIAVSPNSRMTIALNSSSQMTRILQDLGAVLFDVDHREIPHFQVETPLLAALVKGTTFSVTVSPQADAVHVVHGLVGVRSMASGAGEDVATGATARVTNALPGVVTLTQPSTQRLRDLGADAPLEFASAPGGLLSTSPIIGADLSLANGLSSGLALSAGGLTANTGLSLGRTGVGVSAGADAGVATAALGANVGASGVNTNLGLAAAGLGVGASVDAGQSGLTAGVNLGGASAGVNVPAVLGLGGLK